MNKVILTGNLVRDLEFKGKGEVPFAVGSIAVQKNFKNKDGEYDVDFINFIVGGSTAEFLGKYAGKGCKVLLEGTLEQNIYENSDGDEVSTYRVNVSSCEVLKFKEQEDKPLKADTKKKSYRK